jgi:SAM-dependent methyltransferase
MQRPQRSGPLGPAGLRRLVRPLRRAAAWFALVEEERSARLQATQLDQVVQERQLQPLRDGLEALAREVAAVAELAQALREGSAGVRLELESLQADSEAEQHRWERRTTLAVSEVMHGSELSTARLSTELQRLAETARQHEQLIAGLSRSVSGPLAPSAAASGAPLPASSPYQLFEDLERGSRDQVLAGFRRYLPVFAGVDPLVDLGCGRGEFLQLAAAQGWDATGVELDPDAVAVCRGLGLDVVQDDLFSYLRGLAAGALGGVFCAHVVEHLPADLLWPLLDELSRVLRSGGVAAIETPNPATFATHVHAFWRDPTHLRPVPAPALWFAARRAGLSVQDTWYFDPPPPDQRLRRLAVPDEPAAAGPVAALVAGYNDSIDALNGVLFGPQSYAVVLRKS